MDDSNQPQEPTQVVPPVPPAYPSPAAPPSAYPPPAPPPAYPPQGQPPDYPPPTPWPAPAGPVGPAPGLAFAPHGARLLAYVVDVIISSVLVTVVAIGLGLIVAALAIAGADVLAVLIGVLVFAAVLLVSLLYFPWFWVKGGATPGMRIFNLRIVRDRDGGPIGWGEAFLRLFGFWVSSLVLYLGFAWIFVDARRRGWHDLLAGTVMVQPT